MDELKLLQETRRDLDWLHEDYKSIRERYGGRFIVLKNQQIIASAATKRLAYEKIDKLGIAQHEVLIEYIPKKNEIVIF